jgi:uncharacterized membrane protein
MLPHFMSFLSHCFLVQDPVVASLASERGVKLAFEIIFRHASRLLADWAYPEATFTQQLFNSKQLLEKVFKKAADLLVVRAVPLWTLILLVVLENGFLRNELTLDICAGAAGGMATELP